MGLTLRDGNREYFYSKLDKHFPKLKEKYIRTYGNSYQIPSPNDKQLTKIFYDVCFQNGIMSDTEECFKYLNIFEDKYSAEQISLL